MLPSPRLLLPRLAAALCPLALAGCSSLDYYAHLARGEYGVLSARRPVSEVIADPKSDARLKERLQLARQARAFASDRLDLPRNGSYTVYADVGRPYVVWNVFATPEFSLKPVTHCFPIAGCVGYRGYFDRDRAEAEAKDLRARGNDTYIGGVPAYSTLGWFDDPILNTMMRWDDDTLDSSIFHELAHQKLYLKGDTAFNESFATFVQQQGLRQWRESRGLPPGEDAAGQREEQFTDLVLAARARLERLYDRGLPPDLMRDAKQAEIERLRADYRVLRDTQWQGYKGYDAWMDAPINNAKLLPFGLYHKWVQAFATLYAQQHGDWDKFYAAARALSEQGSDARTAALERLQARTTTQGAAP
ncbi:MAG: aminopeptidase [Nevskia sp.]|nr:aminopeptidase [Nevskia sp.]